jgi:hypothetical protein
MTNSIAEHPQILERCPSVGSETGRKDYIQLVILFSSLIQEEIGVNPTHQVHPFLFGKIKQTNCSYQ